MVLAIIIDAFWQLLEVKTYNVFVDDYISIAGNLNDRVGEKPDGNRRHGRKGFRTRTIAVLSRFC